MIKNLTEKNLKFLKQNQEKKNHVEVLITTEVVVLVTTEVVVTVTTEVVETIEVEAVGNNPFLERIKATFSSRFFYEYY